MGYIEQLLLWNTQAPEECVWNPDSYTYSLPSVDIAIWVGAPGNAMFSLTIQEKAMIQEAVRIACEKKGIEWALPNPLRQNYTATLWGHGITAFATDHPGLALLQCYNEYLSRQ